MHPGTIRRGMAGTALAAALAAGAWAPPGSAAGGAAARPEGPQASLPASNHAPHQLAFRRDGARLYVTEAVTHTVALLDPRQRRLLRRFPSGGERPAGLALAPDGATLLVANSFSGDLALLDAESGRLLARLPLRGMPWGVALAPDGRRAFVTLSQLDAVALVELDPAAGRLREVRRVAVGRRPRALALTPDGGALAVANMAEGSLSVLDAATLREEARVRLKGVNVRGLALTPDGREAYATVMPAFNRRPASDPKEVWHNLVQSVTLEGSASEPGEDQWMDFARIPGRIDLLGSPDQHDIAIDPSGRHAWVAVAGRDVVAQITLRDPRRMAVGQVWPFTQNEVRVGLNPRGLALSPDGRELWVANYLGNSLSVVDAERPALLATVDLGPATAGGEAPGDPAARYGEALFHGAGLTRAQRFTCNSCHPDGASDGLVWRFVHVPDGLDGRNSRDLRAGIGDTAPFRWSGFDAHLSGFIEEEVTGLLGGPKPEAAQVRALEAFLGTLRLPPNPYREADGSFTPAAERGRRLFEGKAGCVACHSGPKRGGAGARAWIGTTPEGRLLDVPHLMGVYDSAPYLHDGRAETLEAIFREHDPNGRHGNARRLAPEELSDLLRYVREL